MKRSPWFLPWCLSVALAGAAQADARLDALRQTAQAGDAVARYELGVLYEFGRGGHDRLVTALAWYRLAAEQGNAAAAARRDALQAHLSAAEVEAATRLADELRHGATANPPP